MKIKEDPNFPKHIAIIMDGNGRWARRRALPSIFGHRAGAERVPPIVQACVDLGVKVLTLYAFSWENWDRPRREIDILMKLLVEFLQREAPTLHANSVRLTAIGRLHELPEKPLASLQRIMDETAHYDRMTLVLALSYGGRQEIVDAVKRLAQVVRDGKLKAEEITEAHVMDKLYTSGLPDPDLLIRTSGEMRLSNFLLWQNSYAELYVTQTLWPDFNQADLEAAIVEFKQRSRRFGKRTKPAKSNQSESKHTDNEKGAGSSHTRRSEAHNLRSNFQNRARTPIASHRKE